MCDIKPDKVKTHRTNLTVGGDLLDYSVVLSTPTATVTTKKCLLDNIVPAPNAKCLTADIKHFYLNNHLPDPEYMKLHISIIPEKIIEAYSFSTIQYNNGWVYIRIYMGMYGLKQAVIIANLELKNIWKSLVIILFASQPVFGSTKPRTPSSYW